jgi:crossover junction endodeoxyribonuclease RusA
VSSDFFVTGKVLLGMIQFTVPATPPYELSQNSRMDWRPKQAIKHAWQKVVGDAAVVARNNDGLKLYPDRSLRYWVHIEVYWEKGHRTVDDDNLVASFKSARDTIAGVFGIDDKQFRTGEVTQWRDETGVGRTVVTIEERDGPWAYVAPTSSPKPRRSDRSDHQGH